MLIKGEKNRNKIIVAFLLIAVLLLGFYFGRADIEEMENINNAELMIMADQTEKAHQQISEYSFKLFDLQIKLQESRDALSKMTQYGSDTHAELLKTRDALSEITRTPPTQMPVEIIREVTVYVETEKEAPQELREFESLMELNGWLEKNTLSKVLITNSSGKVDLVNRKSTPQYDCDDYAENLQRRALEQGFLMSQQLLEDGKIYGVKVSEATEGHMGNLTTIGNDIFYIESIPPHNVVKIVSRD